jgi:hypothetical protein
MGLNCLHLGPSRASFLTEFLKVVRFHKTFARFFLAAVIFPFPISPYMKTSLSCVRPAFSMTFRHSYRHPYHISRLSRRPPGRTVRRVHMIPRGTSLRRIRRARIGYIGRDPGGSKGKASNP